MGMVSYPQVKGEKNLPLYVTGVGIDNTFLPEGEQLLPFYRIVTVTSGEGVLWMKGQRYSLKTGDGIFLKSGAETRLASGEEKGDVLRVDWIAFEMNLDGLDKTLFATEDFSFFRFAENDGILHSLRRIQESLVTDEGYGGFSASAELYKLLIEINREALVTPKPNVKISPVVRAVISYIDSNFTRDVTLAELCEAAGGVSEQYLCRLFKQHTGERPIEYILHKRIAAARSYLEKSDIPIPDIANEIGFHNTSYFYRNFKKFTGVSPLVWRQNALRRSVNTMDE